jgi:hypothetical protein
MSDDEILGEHEEMSSLDYKRDEMLSAYTECEACGRTLDMDSVEHCNCGRDLCHWCKCDDCEESGDHVENPLL